MEEIIMYVESFEDFSYSEMRSEVVDLIEDMKLAEMLYARNQTTKRKYNFMPVPFHLPSDKILFASAFSNHKYNIREWENVFYIIKALEYLYEKQYDGDFKLNEKISSKVVALLDKKGINPYHVIRWYEHK